MAFTRQRLAIFWHLLGKKHKAQRQHHESTTLEEAQQIAILFKGDDPSHYVQIKKMIKPLKEAGKKVEVFGYIDAKETEELVAHPHFNRKQVNFFYLPQGNEVSYFTKHPFDILIYAHPDFCPQLFYIAAMSKAKMRVGPYLNKIPANVDAFDLLIKLEEQPSMKQLLENYLTYLKMIKTNEYE